MSKLFSCDYLIKVWQNVTEMGNVSFEEIYTESSRGIFDGF